MMVFRIEQREPYRFAGDCFVRAVSQFDRHLVPARLKADQDHRFAAI